MQRLFCCFCSFGRVSSFSCNYSIARKSTSKEYMFSLAHRRDWLAHVTFIYVVLVACHGCDCEEKLLSCHLRVCALPGGSRAARTCLMWVPFNHIFPIDTLPLLLGMFQSARSSCWLAETKWIWSEIGLWNRRSEPSIVLGYFYRPTNSLLWRFPRPCGGVVKISRILETRSHPRNEHVHTGYPNSSPLSAGRAGTVTAIVE